jgi:glycosyltransferase involved in cell wall biosynthesis
MIDEIYQSLDARLAKDVADEAFKEKAVYCYEDGAFDTFQTARARGIATLYDLPIGYHTVAQKIFQEEAFLKPEWAVTLTGLQDSIEKLERKAKELSLADHVVVASSFTASTLAGLLKETQKLSIVPYGAPAPCPLPEGGVRGGRKKLKVLYVGSLTQRKGISYLFDAITPLAPHIELTVVGRMAARCIALEKNLRPHRYYASLPHGKILELMRSHDVLVFPSLFEGFGLVLTEALSCGLPIIATPNTAAPDLITNGVEGFIVPLRSSQAITEKLELMLSGKINLGDMRQAAVAKAQTLGWQNYEKEIIRIVKTYAA